MKTTARLLAALALVTVGFAWGFAAHRQRIFPFWPLRGVALRVGALEEDKGIAWAGEFPTAADFAALPYGAARAGVPDAGGGVIQEARGNAFAGLTLVTTRSAGSWQAKLIELDGHPRFRWRLPGMEGLQVVKLLPSGDLLLIDQGRSLSRVARSGTERWRVEGRFHHSVEVSGDMILTLRSRARRIPRIQPRAVTEDDEIVWLSLDGRELRTLSLADALLASPVAFLIPSLADEDLREVAAHRSPEEVVLDIFHANHAVALPALAVQPWGGPGEVVLVSLRNLNLLVAIDSDGDVRWAWGPGRVWHQHHPTLLEDGHLLLFDNGRRSSRVLEVDLGRGTIIWRYAAPDFFAEFGGSAQRLPNGNTLVTESPKGRVFEITARGQRVWSWLNPDIDENGARQPIYRALRYAADELPFLAQRQ